MQLVLLPFVAIGLTCKLLNRKLQLSIGNRVQTNQKFQLDKLTEFLIQDIDSTMLEKGFYLYADEQNSATTNSTIS
jgi:hypothetical protein